MFSRFRTLRKRGLSNFASLAWDTPIQIKFDGFGLVSRSPLCWKQKLRIAERLCGCCKYEKDHAQYAVCDSGGYFRRPS